MFPRKPALLFSGNFAEPPPQAFLIEAPITLYVFNQTTNTFKQVSQESLEAFLLELWSDSDEFYKNLLGQATTYCGSTLEYLTTPDHYLFLLSGALPSELK